jgi:PAS domain S-box-containing protein
MRHEQASSILIVEDEVLTAKALQRSFERLGYAVLPIATSAGEAIDLAFELKPSLVLMDIYLDGRADGIEAADAINTRLNIPVVFLTAFSDDDTVQRVKKAAPYGYVVKPVRFEELRAVVEVALHKHELEKRLRERERWFSTTLRSIADAVICVDPHAAVTFMNSAAEFMTGVSFQSGLGQPIRKVLRLAPLRSEWQEATDAFDAETPLERALREARVIDLPEARLKNLTNGEELIISDAAAQVIADGELLGAVMVFRNITAQKQLEETLRVSDRMASVGLLAAGIAHEINNPLTVVIGNTSNLQAALADLGPSTSAQKAALAELIEDTATASMRIRDIVRDLMLFSKSERAELCNVDVHSVMQSTLRLANNAIRHCARLETNCDEVPPIFGSESQLGQVFLNVLINAAQAIPEGHAAQQTIRVELYPSDEGDVVITVTDSGSGMPQAILDRIFTPFFTTKPVGTGTGLGLSICNRIITGLGGTIRIASKPGQGTTVRIVLPPSKTETPCYTKKRSPTPIKRRGRVMVLDDEPMVARVLERMLAPDHEVVVFHGAKAALAHILSGVGYDAIVCDLLMPDMNGMDFHDELAARCPEQAERIVFVSGGGFTPRALAFLATTQNPKLDKPIDVAALLVLIDERVRDSDRMAWPAPIAAQARTTRA